MIDTLLANLGRLREPQFWASARLEPGKYLVLTLHRPANVDDPASLRRLLDTIVANARGRTIVFPVHPRTAKTLREIEGLPPNIRFVDPQPYLEFNWLVKHAKAVITDSGGITEETTVMGIPCMTLRDSTERPETVTVGTNELLGTDPAAIPPALDRLFAGQWKKGRIPDQWDGQTAPRIVEILERLLPAA
jgi:UDP-N-acetylglucosamine 2-epimerase (non-hydrolysing)